jgi:hypothetical protein
MTDLSRLIDAVQVKLAGVETPSTAHNTDWTHWHRTGDRIIQELRDEHGARIRIDRDPATMRLGGVSTSATGGWKALLTNWVAAARKRLVNR